jgi:hypothetical protein
MNCIEAHERMSAYIDRQLSPAEQITIGLHATVCESCGMRLHSYLQIKQALRRQALPRIPESIVAAIRSAAVEPRAPAWMSWAWWLPAAVLATAAGAWVLMKVQATAPRGTPLRRNLIAWQRAADSSSVTTQ